MEKNFYEILGITEEEKNLPESEFNKVLSKNYKNLAKKWHPDRFATKSEEERNEAEEKFKEISEAYNTLSDANKRRQYDFGSNGSFNPFEGMDDDPFTFFRNMHGGGGPRIVKGQNIQVNVDITLEESYQGKEKTIKFNRIISCGHCNGTGSENGKVEICPHCNGSGVITERRQVGNMLSMTSRPCNHCHGTGKKITNPCRHCNGSGSETILVEETITIPKGIDNGQYIILKERGCEVSNNKNSINGDLIVVFNVSNQEFVRNGDDLIKTIDVNIFDAILGTEKTITAIDGKDINIKIPELTKPSHTFVIKDKGMPNVNNPKHYGNMRVVVNYKMPNNLSKEDKKILEKFR